MSCGKAEWELDLERVPEDLRDLIPYAIRWGIGDDVRRSECQEKSTERERVAFREALRGRTADIQEWLSSDPSGYVPNEEAGLYMDMLLALDEMGIWPDPPPN